MYRVGVTVLVGAIGEIENVTHAFQPDGRLPTPRPIARA
jgi:hypothetical protein